MLNNESLAGLLGLVPPRLPRTHFYTFLDPEGGSQKATLVVVRVGIGSLKIPVFLDTQRSATKLCMYILRAHIPHISIVSDFQVISVIEVLFMLSI